MKGFVHNADQSFYFNGNLMSGISSVDASYSIETEDNNFLGFIGPADFIQNAPGVGKFYFQRTMISSDESITSLIGETGGFDGGIEYNQKTINFQSGYIDNYECSFNVDQLPESSVSISAFGEVGPNVQIKKEGTYQGDFFIPSSSGISIDFDGRETNRVTSFSFSMVVKNTPVYKIGSIMPCEVIPETPIRQNLNISVAVDDYETIAIYNHIKTGIHWENIKVVLRDKCDQNRKIEYHFQDAHLLSENFSTNADNDANVQLRYSTVSRYKPKIIYS